MPLIVLGYIVVVISIGLSIYNMIAAANYTPPEPPVPSPKDVGHIPTAEQGRPVPVLFGKRKIERPNVVYWGNPHSTKNKVNQSELT